MTKGTQRMLTVVDTLPVSGFAMQTQEPTLIEIDEALVFALQSLQSFKSEKQQKIISGFIDDLLDARLENKIDNNHCN